MAYFSGKVTRDRNLLIVEHPTGSKTGRIELRAEQSNPIKMSWCRDHRHH